MTHMTPEQIKTLREMRDDGIKNADIAAQLGLSMWRLSEAVKHHNLPPAKGRRIEIDAAKFEAEWMAGTPSKEMAAMFGAASVTSIREFAEKQGLPRRAGSGRPHKARNTNSSRIDRIKEMRAAGMKNPQIAAVLKIALTTLEKIISYNEMPRIASKSEINAERMREMYLDGMIYRDIAEALGMNQNTVASYIRGMGLPPRKSGAPVRNGKPCAVPVAQATDAPADPFAGVTGLDRELLMAGRSETKRAEVAARNGLTMTQARIKWFRLVQEYGG